MSRFISSFSRCFSFKDLKGYFTTCPLMRKGASRLLASQIINSSNLFSRVRQFTRPAQMARQRSGVGSRGCHRPHSPLICPLLSLRTCPPHPSTTVLHSQFLTLFHPRITNRSSCSNNKTLPHSGAYPGAPRRPRSRPRRSLAPRQFAPRRRVAIKPFR